MSRKGKQGKATRVALAVVLAASAVPADAFASGADGDGAGRYADGGAAQVGQGPDGAGLAEAASPLARPVSESADVTDGGNSYRWTLYADGGIVVAPLQGQSSGVIRSQLPWQQDRLKTKVNSVEFSGRLKLANAERLFDGCSSLYSVYFADLDTSSVTSMAGMFGRSSHGAPNIGCSSLYSLNLSGLDTSSVTDMGLMFYGCSSLASIDLSGFDTSKVENMTAMFSGCTSLSSLDLSGFDTSNVTSMASMFGRSGGLLPGCTSLKSLDLSGFDTSKVTDMVQMFDGCRSLSSLDLSGFDTSNVTDMAAMFDGCSSLSSLDVSGFDTSNVERMIAMFSDCKSLESLDLSGFDTSKVKEMGINPGYPGMFAGCSSLRSLDLSGFDTSNVTWMYGMFAGCSSLRSLDLSGFDMSRVTNATDMFSHCDRLSSVALGGKWRFLAGGALPDPGSAAPYTGLWVNEGSHRGPYSSGDLAQAYNADPSGMAGEWTWERQEADIAGAEVSGVEASYPETGSPVDIRPVVTLGGEALAEGADYEVSYRDSSGKAIAAPSEPGSYTLVVTGKGGYTGEKEVPFEIVAATYTVSFDANAPAGQAALGAMGPVEGRVGRPLALPRAQYSLAGYRFLGWATSPGGSVAYADGESLPQGVPGAEAGSTVTLYAVWEAEQPPAKGDLSDAEVSGVEASYVETGSPVDIHPVVTLGGEELSEGVDYDLSYRDSSGKAIPAPSGAGSYALVISGKGGYAGTVDVPFRIVSDSDVYESGEVTDEGNSYRWTLYADGDLMVEPLQGQSSGDIESQVPWKQDRLKNRIKSIEFSGRLRLASYAHGFFSGCPSLSSLDLSGLDTSNVTDMSSMFFGCSSLSSLDLSCLDTSNVTDMMCMFTGCTSLSSLDLSGLDTSNVTDMSFMFGQVGSFFSGCTSLSSLDLSGLDTSNVTEMTSMFSGCRSLSSLDLSGLDTSNVTDMSSMFSGCTSLSSVALGGKWRFLAGGGLPDPSRRGPYTGLWVNEGSHRGPYSSWSLAKEYNEDPSGMAGTWAWERRQGVLEADLARAEVYGVEAHYAETGSPVDIRPVVTLGGEELSEGADYDLSYRDSSGKAVPAPSAPGSYRLVVTGRVDYTGEKEVAFEISGKGEPKVPLADASFAVIPVVYRGDPVSPAIAVAYDGRPLENGVDYLVAEVAYDLDAGSGFAVLVGAGRFTGGTTVRFDITVPDDLRFADVSANDWYFGSVAYARANGIVSGYAGTDLFGPDDQMTRAQAAAILQRVLDPDYDPSSSGAEPNRTGMPDVEGGSWYSAAANWAVANGVISGVEEPGGGRTFRPDDPVTREQLCAIVRNASERFGGAAGSDDPSRLDSMPDAWQVSGWARDSVAWGVNQGVITGVDEGGARYARPLDPVTRAQMAAVMMNSIQGGVLKR